MTQKDDVPESYSYAQAGVSIAAGNALVRAIAPLAKSTSRAGANAELGDFGGFIDRKAAGHKDHLLVAANEDVGPQMELENENKRPDGRAKDLYHHSVNGLT